MSSTNQTIGGFRGLQMSTPHNKAQANANTDSALKSLPSNH